MAASENSNASIFEKNHKTQIEYPVLKLLPDNAQPYYLNTCNATNRYEPRPLVAATAVATHASRENENETKIWSITKAHQGGELSLSHILSANPIGLQRAVAAGASAPSPTMGLSRLCADMLAATGGAGSTVLHVIMFKKTRAITFLIDGRVLPSVEHSSPDYLRVQRVTDHQFSNGRIVQSKFTYTFEVNQAFWRIFDSAWMRDQAWMQDLQDLLRMRSDRAVRHIRVRSLQQDLNDPDADWKAPRRVLGCEEPIRAAVVPVSPMDISNNNDDSCICCTEKFREVHQPCRLRCHESHWVCFGCLVEIFHTAVPEQPRCPHCRAPIFADDSVMLPLLFGIDPNDSRAYKHDDRYSEWESFERSHADLDQVHSSVDSTKITIDTKFTSAIFELLVNMEKKEPAWSTPIQMQPAQRPECAALLAAVEQGFQAFGDQEDPISIKTAYVRIERLIHEFLYSEVKRLTGIYIRDPDDVATLARDPGMLYEILGWEVGFLELTQRVLSRTLQFLRLRRCSCENGGNKPMHQHGDRLYFQGKEGLAQEARRRASAVLGLNAEGFEA